MLEKRPKIRKMESLYILKRDVRRLGGGRAIREEEIREKEEKEELPLDRFMQALPNLVGVFSHSRLIKITITMIRSMLI